MVDTPSRSGRTGAILHLESVTELVEKPAVTVGRERLPVPEVIAHCLGGIVR